MAKPLMPDLKGFWIFKNSLHRNIFMRGLIFV
jgi:hypothetical protein